jgi:hypothetical protein
MHTAACLCPVVEEHAMKELNKKEPINKTGGCAGIRHRALAPRRKRAKLAATQLVSMTCRHGCVIALYTMLDEKYEYLCPFIHIMDEKLNLRRIYLDTACKVELHHTYSDSIPFIPPMHIYPPVRHLGPSPLP